MACHIPLWLLVLFPYLVETAQRNISLIQVEPQHEVSGDAGTQEDLGGLGTWRPRPPSKGQS